MKKALLMICFTLVSALLTGCGFHMRGSVTNSVVPANMHTLHVEGDTRGNIYRDVTSRLKQAGVTLTTETSKNIPVLHIDGMTVGTNKASVDSNSEVVEYVMVFNTNYQVTLPNQQPQHFSARFSRVFLNKSSQALASSREQTQLVQEMEEQTANLILTQLSHIAY